MNSKTDYFKNLLIFLAIITLYRLFVLLNSNVDLYADEAYYWGWSKHLDFGYYSKPPMIAWVIAFFTSICGDSEICVKLPALIFYPFTTIIIFFIAKELYEQKTAFWSAFVFITLPAVSMSSMIISTDVVLLFFWSLLQQE
jgi:4-amino-4-deoxy-L-arabinose transferase-like glycosyltransferase